MCFPKTIKRTITQKNEIDNTFKEIFMAEFKNAEEMLKNYTTHGCFVVAGERPNVMTASWGFFGEMWGKKVVVVPVRDSRFTKGIIDEKREFTLCVPFGDKYKKELVYCGTKSGRDCDKVKDLSLKITPAKKVNTYVIDGCGAYYECKVLQVMNFSGQDISPFVLMGLLCRKPESVLSDMISGRSIILLSRWWKPVMKAN